MRIQRTERKKPSNRQELGNKFDNVKIYQQKLMLNIGGRGLYIFGHLLIILILYFLIKLVSE